MKLSKFPLVNGTFISRPNRFIAHVMIEKEEKIAHVPNTGRMGELLVPGVSVVLAYNPSPNRKTDYTLLLVKNKGCWVSVHSVFANKIAYAYLKEQEGVTELRQEVTYGNSRFDLACRVHGKKALFEVKSVNLVIDEVAMFPDAPTERGSKHLGELIEAQKEGYKTGVIFVIQRKDAKSFRPNKKMDPKFAGLLGQCHSLGIEIRALSCDIDGVNIEIVKELPIYVESGE